MNAFENPFNTGVKSSVETKQRPLAERLEDARSLIQDYLDGKRTKWDEEKSEFREYSYTELMQSLRNKFAFEEYEPLIKKLADYGSSLHKMAMEIKYSDGESERDKREKFLDSFHRITGINQHLLGDLINDARQKEDFDRLVAVLKGAGAKVYNGAVSLSWSVIGEYLERLKTESGRLPVDDFIEQQEHAETEIDFGEFMSKARELLARHQAGGKPQDVHKQG